MLHNMVIFLQEYELEGSYIEVRRRGVMCSAVSRHTCICMYGSIDFHWGIGNMQVLEELMEYFDGDLAVTRSLASWRLFSKKGERSLSFLITDPDILHKMSN